MRSPGLFLAFGFGSGLSPKAPGTTGSLAALPLIFGLTQIPAATALVTIVALFLLGIRVSNKACETLRCHDHPGIVIDEIVGMLVTFFLIPISAASLFLGFIFFRTFDILKPWPIGLLDKKVKGGLGIMMDDIVAGILSNLLLQILGY